MAKKPKIQGGVAGTRAHFLDAMAEIEEAREIFDPEPSLPRDGIKPGQWPGNPHDAMPPKCPMTVLGMKGETIYCVSATGNLHEVTRWDQPTLIKLFAPYTNYLYWAWPAFGKAETDPQTGEPMPPKVKRLERDKAITALITEAGRRGIFDPQENVRGRGGWRSQDQMVWHSGKHIWMVDVKRQAGKAIDWQLKRAKPGEFDGMFYRQDSETLTPWQSPIGWLDSPAHQLLQDFTTWNWMRPNLDPLFLLGWIAAAIMGAALKRRPIVFIVGGRGTGKSTLHDMIKAILGPVLYATANTTAAGIYQNIGQDSRPVAVDEFEAKAGGFKEQAIIELARQAYSGAKLYRGGSNHEGVEFELRSAFLFSAIMHPPLGVQDKSRMAILQLKKLENDGAAEPVVSDHMGRMMLRQIMDGFEQFDQEILPNWKRTLHEAGFDARQIDTYGTLLAAAELMVGKQGMIDVGFPADDPEFIIDMLRQATATERAEQTEKWQDVIEKIMSTTIDAYKSGEKLTVGGVLEVLEDTGRSDITLPEARARLALVDLGLREEKDEAGRVTGHILAVPHNSPKLDRVFENSDYYKGGWTQALKQAPEGVVLHGLPYNGYVTKINRVAKYCSLVSLRGYDAVVGVD